MLQSSNRQTKENETNTKNISQKQKMIPGFTLVDTCRFSLRTVEEAKTLSRFASEFFSDPARAEPGLHELLLNAVEHGCLGIGALKSDLIMNGTWEEEVLRRQSLPENRVKHVEMVIARKPQGAFAIINDPGAGFDWKSWLLVDPARAGQAHGRGIARARSISFDVLAYNPVGNQAVVQMKHAPGMVW